MPNRMLMKAQKDHHAMEPYSIEEFMATMRLRGEPGQKVTKDSTTHMIQATSES